MAAKRSATNELNHDNWDHDDEPEDSGTFKKASEESLKRRIIKTAKRRNPISSVRSPDTENKSAFKGFNAFTKNTSETITPTFSFLSNVSGQTKTNGTSKDAESKTKMPSVILNKKPLIFGNTTSNINETNGKSNDYYAKLKGLNESVLNWIKAHVEKNPLINLQPIFKDYEKYFKDLEETDKETKEKEKHEKKKDDSMSSFVFKTTIVEPKTSESSKSRIDLEKNDLNKKVPQFSFGKVPASTDGKPSFGFSDTSTMNTFSFASSNMSATASSTSSTFSFGSTTSVSPFSLSGGKPFTFGNVATPSTTVTNKEEPKEDEEEPPKNDFKPVVEKDHIFTTRCKVFVKKDENFGDRGVGNLYLKKINDSEKVQLIVRADTNLGNLLCNFILSESVPTKRVGKKDVMLVCLPTPDVKPPPVPILLRVKSPEEADNLLETLEKHKK